MTDTPTIAALRAALAAGRWYVMSRDGMATLCTGLGDALRSVSEFDISYGSAGPHKAVRLIDSEPVSELLAELDRLRSDLAAAQQLAADRLAQMQADRKQALVWRDELDRLRAKQVLLR